jgi:hypothetical protein
VLIFNLPKLAARFVDIIVEHRPLLGIKRGERDFSLTSKTALAVPHHVYVMGLNDIAARENPLPQNPAALRVFEVEEGRIRAVYDLSPTEQGDPPLQSMTDDPATVEPLQKGLSEAQRLAHERGNQELGHEQPELLFIRVPALYVETYWLRYPDRARDLVVPVRAIGLFTVFRPIPARDFIARLRQAARERLKGSGDDGTAA